MKPSKLFVSLEDFSNRFKDTFIYYQGVPYYVHSCTITDPRNIETLAFVAFEFKNGYDPHSDPKIIKLNDEEVNFRQYNVGYVKYNDFSSLWAMRCPARQWKQGFRRDQCQTMGYNDSEQDVTILGPNSWTYDMLMNTYQTVDEAKKALQASPLRSSKIPIHKNFAIYGTRAAKKFLGVEYKGIPITPFDSEVPVLKNGFKYLLDIPEYSRLMKQLVANA